MKKRLAKMLMWSMKKLGYRFIEVPKGVRELALGALPIVLKFEGDPGSGEYKLNETYGKMLKAFPNAARDDISFAIQIAVRRMKGKLSWH